MKAPRLRRGDTIGIVSPSWGGAGRFPHRLERGVQQLTALGFKVRLGWHALNTRGFVSDTAQNRADDLHQMFIEPSVRAIIAAVGGDHGCHLLPLLDFELIRRNPKIFVGCSDLTVLNVAIWRAAGLVTFNGPTVLAEFAEHPEMLAYTREGFLQAVTSAAPLGVVQPALAWTQECLDWSTREDLERPRRLEPASGWTWLKEGVAEGRLVGGCLESLQHLRGTRFWPDWDGAIWFFETSEQAPSPARVDSILMDYENMGVLERLRGLLVGRPMGYTPEQRQELRDVIGERTRAFRFPVITDMDFGHTSPQFTLPLGCRARIDSQSRTFEVMEGAVTD